MQSLNFRDQMDDAIDEHDEEFSTGGDEQQLGR